MNRRDFHELARARLRDTEALIKARHYSAAYYLSGYIIECALKACIAKKTKRHDFPPDQNTVKKLYVHDLAGLAKEASLDSLMKAEGARNKNFEANWEIVKNWTERTRYEKHSRAEATDLYEAIADPADGVFKWLQTYW